MTATVETLTRKQVCAALQISLTTFKRLAKKKGPNGLRVRKVGRLVRVPRAELERFLEGRPR